MGALTPSGIWVPGTTDPVEFHITASIMAVSGSDAIGGLGVGKRQPRLYSVADQAGKTSSTQMFAVGDRLYVAATDWVETYTAAGWVVTDTLTAVPFTPDWSGGFLLPGDGVNRFVYWVKGSEVTVQGNFTLAANSSFYNENPTEIPLPIPAIMQGVTQGAVGICQATNGAGTQFYGEMLAQVGKDTYGRTRTMIYPYFKNPSHAGGVRVGLAASTPFVWSATGASNREFSVSFTYLRA